MPNYILSLTKNNKKLREQQNIFQLHGIRVFNEEQDEWNKVATIIEESNLFKAVSPEEISDFQDMEIVINKCKLSVVFPNGTSKVYESEIGGHINLSLSSGGDDIFGWDEIFVGNANCQNFMNQEQKISARNIAISQFIKEFLYLTKEEASNFSLNECVNFDNLLKNHINKTPFISKIGSFNKELENLKQNVINSGVFIKQPKNKRQRNYWCPTFNGGLPITQKRDDFHSDTFMFHDVCHFAMPDLIYSGEDDELSRKIYVTYRMLTEAFSLVLADMIFVDSLKSEASNYDFSKRKIYPLYQKISGATLKEIIYANAKFCLFGDLNGFKAISDSCERELAKYSEKYAKFFSEDFLWTDENFKNMVNRSSKFKLWHSEFSNLFYELDYNKFFFTISEFKERFVNKERIFESIFEYLFDLITRLMKNSEEISEESILEFAFKRYMIGQSFIFFDYQYLKESKYYMLKIKEQLNSRINSIEKISSIRNFYNNYLKILFDNKYITSDDLITFKEIYPMFKPHYVFYDNKKTNENVLENLREVSSNVLCWGK